MSIEIEQPANEAEVFAMNRRFKVGRDLMWRLWTEEQHLRRWWGPAGMTLQIKQLVFEPGGMMLYGMVPVSGATHWGKFVYRLIEPPARLVYVVSFTDSDGALIRHPMSPLWPLEMLADMRFNEIEDGCEISSRFYPINASAQDRQMFQLGRSGLQIGFEGSYAALDRYLTTL